MGGDYSTLCCVSLFLFSGNAERERENPESGKENDQKERENSRESVQSDGK